MKKLFRHHRGTLADSLATTIEVSCLADLKRILADKIPWAHNVRIDPNVMADARLPKDWDGVCYYVVADFYGYKGQCIGMCNFFDK